MKRSLAVVAALLSVAASAPSGAGAAGAAACGLPDVRPLWIDYAEGSVSFRQAVFARPGIVAATSGAIVPPALRTGGAQTVYWEMKLGSIVGTTTKPADPASIEGAAQKLFDKAVASSGCATPLVALNELNGASTTTPWTATNAQYRANVLALVRALAARGARSFLLVSSAPYTGGEAAAWWRETAQATDIVQEVYFNAPAVYKQGPVLASRRMRAALRAAIASYTAIGIPVARLGYVLGFQSGPGAGGREGLQPSSAWLRFVKLYTLAGRQVGSEFAVATVWTWGWGTFNEAGADADKESAACVYLWARDESLCDGPAAAGDGFEASLTEGQIDLPPGIQCRLDGKALLQTTLSRLAAVTRNREVAFSILYGRLVETERASVSKERVLEAERAIVAGRFAGDRSAYLAALARVRANVYVARDAIADELVRAQVEARIRVPAPTEGQIAAFYAAYSDVLVREFQVMPAAAWLGGRSRGFALAAASPTALFRLPSGLASPFESGLGSWQVTPLDEPLPLGAVPLDLARPAIRTALVSFARAGAFEEGTRVRQERALNRTVCLRDDLPSVGIVSVPTYLPFLALNA